MLIASAEEGCCMPHRRSRRRSLRLWRLIRANLYDLGLLINESWIVLVGFLVVTLLGTLYLRFGYDPCRYDSDPSSIGCNLSIAEALYETIKLQTLQSGLAFPQRDLLGMVLFFLIPLLGLALIFQGVLNFGRLLLDKGSRREAWQVALASAYRDHVIVCGLGRVGMRTVQQVIDAGYDPVVIDINWQSEFVLRALARNVPVIVGDAREPLTLRRAGIQRARAVVAAINGDLINIEIALAARAIRRDLRVVLRVFSEELDQNLEKSMGHNAAFSASALAAPTFAAAAVSREIAYVIPTTQGLLGLTSLNVQSESRITGFGSAIEEAYNVRMVHHETPAGRNLTIGSINRISGGDRITLIGSIESLEAARLDNQRGNKLDFLSANPIQHPTEQYDTVIVCGLGKVGYRVICQLHAMRPRPRIVVVRLANGRPDFPQRIAELPGVRLVIGDAREEAVLRQAGISQAFSVAALTSDDLLNLQISLAARRLRPDVHIVLRVFSDGLAERLGEMFGIRTTYSTSALASPTLAAAALVGGVLQGCLIDQQLYATEQLRIEPTSPLANLSIEQIRERFGVIVIEHQKHGQPTNLPPNDLIIQAQDQLLVIGPIVTIAQLRA
jgi:Trk K+ transport system NAD-binding subunit